MSTFKPMLAGTPKDFSLVKFPVLASPKIDGVRGANVQGSLLSRSLKLIPNKHVQSVLGIRELHGLDGELIVGSPTDPNAMQNTTSGVMSHDKVPAFTYHVFDYWDFGGGFKERFDRASIIVRNVQHDWVLLRTKYRLKGEFPFVSSCPIVLVPHKLIRSLDELDAFEAEMLDAGWEGVMIRSLDGQYKYGRSTPKEGGLLKVKRFTDGEAIIIGFEEQMYNGNEATTNELGRTKRSSHQAGKTGKGTLGALIVRDVKTGVEFNVGTGLNDGVRAHIWANRDDHEGKIVKYKSFEVGVKDKPRHPVFLAFRDERDMS